MLAASSAQAGQLTGFSWYSGIASVASTTIFPPTAPNNDNVAGPSPNDVFVTQKNYFGIGPVDLVFTVSNTGGVTEYQFREGVFNNTGLDWGAYHLELGFGTGTAFEKSTAGDGLDFDAPDYDSVFNFNPGPGIFPTVSVTTDDVYASGGVMPWLTFAGYFRFAVDVPDGITEFTIRQSPVPVPEPSTVTIAALGVVVLAGFARRRRR
jgi:MYXO-CTERM domain-containing protein